MANDIENTTPVPEEEGAMVPVFSSSNHDAELEAMAVKGVLESSGIPAMIVGPAVLPTLEFQVQVPADLLEKARLVIRDARQGGREAAEEAERATEI